MSDESRYRGFIDGVRGYQPSDNCPDYQQGWEDGAESRADRDRLVLLQAHAEVRAFRAFLGALLAAGIIIAGLIMAGIALDRANSPAYGEEVGR